jgi:hypothetical protein
MKPPISKQWDWRHIAAMLLGGALSAWLTLDEKSAAAIFGFIGPMIAAVAVIALFALLAVAVLALFVHLSR